MFGRVARLSAQAPVAGSGWTLPASRAGLATAQHSTLREFVAHAKASGLDEGSTVFRGTVFEYQVLRALSRYGMRLRRVGGAGDRGIDLQGTWEVPILSNIAQKRTLIVVVQCKNEAAPLGARPVRELDGVVAAEEKLHPLPPQFRNSPYHPLDRAPVLGILASASRPTEPCQQAVTRSGHALALVTLADAAGNVGDMSSDMLASMFLNTAASKLMGRLQPTTVHKPGAAAGEPTSVMRLTLNNVPMPIKPAQG